MTDKLILKNGLVVTGSEASSVWAQADVVIEGGRIAALGPGAAGGHAGETIAASGTVVMLGLINAHLHSNEAFQQGA